MKHAPTIFASLLASAALWSCGTAEAPAERARLPAPEVSPADAGYTAQEWLREHDDQFVDVLHRLWGMPEPAHAEFRTAELLMAELRDVGFHTETEVADLPTSFVASWGQGRPRIGIVTLLDALPGLSQESLSATRALPSSTRSVDPDAAGHGCGHHLIGAADLAAVLAIRTSMQAHELPGTIRLYGAPAEEIYHGGVYMVRDGAFDDLDALLFWHPSSVTTVMARSGLAMSSFRLDYSGRASDATDAADKGRNALAGVERLTASLRDRQWPSPAVINHVVGEGGRVPSIVPDRANVWFFVHARNVAAVEAIVSEISDTAAALAVELGLGVELRRLSQASPWLINKPMARFLQKELEGFSDEPFELDDPNANLVRELQASFGVEASGVLFEGALPLDFTGGPVPVSDDTADASWLVPRGGFLVACYPVGIASHTWQWTSAGTSDFAIEGARRAARTLANTALALLVDRERLAEIAEEFARTTDGRAYESPLFEGQRPFDHIPQPKQ